MESARHAQSTCCDMLRPGGVLQPLHSFYKSLNINYSKTTKKSAYLYGVYSDSPECEASNIFFTLRSLDHPVSVYRYLIRRVLTAIEYHYYFSCL